MRYIGWMCSYVFCLFLQKNNLTSWKKKTKENERTTNSTCSVHNNQHRATCTSHSTLCSSEESRSLYISQRLRSDAAYSQRCQGISTKMYSYHGNCSEKLTQKRANCKQSIRPSDPKKKRAFLIVRREAPARCIACLGSLRS